jgi:hypothetical protein
MSTAKSVKPDPERAECFRFTSYDYNPETATALLRYTIDDIPFEEELVFAQAPQKLSPSQLCAINHCLAYLHIAAGISYYKAFLPRQLIVETRPLSRFAASFFDDFYLKGLGEFAYLNKIDLRDQIKFPYSADVTTSPSELDLPRSTGVPVGGGKDSSVTLELLRRSDEPLTVLSVGHHRAIDETAAVSGAPLVHIKRTLSPNLFTFNKQGAYNGHVPITGILSFIFVIASILYGFDTIVMSNERSANIGNLDMDGFEVNHQWSKSEAFEITFSKLLKTEMLPSLQYFSLLRPLSELSIAKIFADLGEYHGSFSSCNRTFKIEDKLESRWCGDCDKCRFVFLILAPFFRKKDLTGIFGSNLLDDKNQLSSFQELLGLQGQKPFECVGEIEESIAALALLAKHPEWQDNPTVKILTGQLNISSDTADSYIKKYMTKDEAALMPDRFKKVLDAIT